MPVRQPTKKQLKKERIKILLAEVDHAFDLFKQDLTAKHREERERIEKQHLLFLASLPEEIKNMPLVEFKERGLDFKTLPTHPQAQPSLQKIDSSAVLAKFMKKPDTKPRKSTGASAQVVASKKKVLSSKRKSTMGKKSRASVARKSRILASSSRIGRYKQGGDSSGNDSYVDLSDDEVFFTPSHKLMTPRGPITPKFDTSKPLMRSQLRRAKPGEVAVSLSGSPLLFEGQPEKPSSKSVSLKTQVEVGKKVYHFSEPQLHGTKLRGKDRKEILELHRKLDKMLKN